MSEPNNSAATAAKASVATPLLSVRDLKVHFSIRDSNGWPWNPPGTLKAVNGVSFDLQAGETLGIVGESGCGKSTLARAVLNLVPATEGSVRWQGQDMLGAPESRWLDMRRDVQMIFQDPLASLNPRMTVAQIIGEPLRTHQPELGRDETLQRVRAMMQRVGLSDHQINRYPHEFSGGQCQRIGIARALILQPKLIVCDEPVSALDVSIQAQVLNLLMDLQDASGVAYLFISHNLSVVEHIADEVLVMYLGKAVEHGDKKDIFSRPLHPYTKALLASTPRLDPNQRQEKLMLPGELPSPLAPPPGCSFNNRCPHAIERCRQEVPELAEFEGRLVACHRVAEIN